MIRAVIFHLEALALEATHPRRAELDVLLSFLQARDVKLVVFTTKPLAVNLRLSKVGLPSADLVLTRADVGVGKGSPKWIAMACDRLGVQPHELLYIGGGKQDWRTAINTPVFYFQGAWNSAMQDGVTALTTDSPQEIVALIQHFFDRAPTYAFSYDGSKLPVHIRCMLPFDVQLRGDKGSFSLKSILTYDQDHTIAGNDARHLLMFSLLVSLYSEGLLNRVGDEKPPLFAIFPSSNPHNVSSHFDDYMKVISKIFHGQYAPDLLIRHTPALDTSMERVNARREGRPPNVGVLTHPNTVILNPTHRNKLDNRLVVILDDFCNTGLSLDWARVLLSKAGVQRMILASVGKYRTTQFDAYIPTESLIIDPFRATTYQERDFGQRLMPLATNTQAVTDFQAVVTEVLAGRPYPITDV